MDTVCMVETKLHRNLVEKPHKTKFLGRLKHSWKNNMKWILDK